MTEPVSTWTVPNVLRPDTEKVRRDSHPLTVTGRVVKLTLRDMKCRAIAILKRTHPALWN